MAGQDSQQSSCAGRSSLPQTLGARFGLGVPRSFGAGCAGGGRAQIAPDHSISPQITQITHLQ
jgi:hypothetical protein